MAEEILTLKKFKELAQVNEPHCISIFIPTHRAGEEVNEMLDQKKLKNRLKEVRHELESWQLHNNEIDRLLKPVDDLISDKGFWKYQSDVLAIFLNHNRFEY